jgi:succinyl-CoA--D-citramalate CoA-transferase
VVEDPHYEARENVIEVEDPEIGPFPMQNVIPRLSETPGKVRWPGSKLGQHYAEIYEKVLGLDEEELNNLRERGII